MSTEEKQPVGTRIRFIKDLLAAATGDHPALQYAPKGQLGTITGYNDWEGYMVKTDNWPNEFGARIGEEFEVIKQGA